MKKYTKFLLAAFALSIAMFLAGGVQEANAKGIRIDIYYGWNDKGVCKDYGICKVIITIDFRPNSNGTQDFTTKGDAVVDGGALHVKLDQKVGERAFNDRGQAIFSLSERMDIDAATCRALGYEKLTVERGQYELVDNKFVFKLASAVKLGKGGKAPATKTN